MSKSVVPIRYRRIKPSHGDVTLWSAQALIAVVRVVFRVKEFFASGRKRERLKRFRTKLQELDRERDALLEKIKHDPGDVTNALDDFMAHCGDGEAQAVHNEYRASLRASAQKSEEVLNIVRAAGENKALAVEGLRAYLQDHPDNQSAYFCLGGVLQQIGDWDGSLTAYQQSVKLADDNPVSAFMAQLQTGVVLQEKGELEAALATFRRLIDEATPKTDGLVSLAYLRMGGALERSGDVGGARTAWKQVIKHSQTDEVTKAAEEKLRASG